MGACRVPLAARTVPGALRSSRERRRLGVTALTALVIPGCQELRASQEREESRARQDCGDPRDHLGPSVSKGNVALPGSPEPRGSRDLQDNPDTPELRGPPAFLASKASEATWAPLERKGSWDPPARTGCPVLWGQRVPGASVGYREALERKGTRVSRASLASRDHRALLVSQERLVQLGHQGLWPRRAVRACEAPRGCQDPLDPLGPQESRALLAWKDWMAKMGSQG